MKIERQTKEAHNTLTGSKENVQIDWILYPTVFLSNHTDPVEMIIYRTAIIVATIINNQGPILLINNFTQVIGINNITVGAIVFE